MLTKLPKNLVLAFIVIFAAASFWLWYFLTWSMPHNVEITDIRQDSAVVIWNSAQKENSTIYYSSSLLLLKLLPLTFPFVSVSRQPEKTVNHRVLLTNLSPGKTYYLTLAQNLHFYQTGVQILPQTPKENKTEVITGVVGKGHVLVVAKNKNGDSFSTFTDSQGKFQLEILVLDGPVFLTARDGLKEKTVVVAREIIKQPVLITLP